MTFWFYAVLGFMTVDARFFEPTSLDLDTNEILPPPPPPSNRVVGKKEWVKISNPPPTIVDARLGDRVEMECEAIGSPVPEIEWFRGERAVHQMRKPSRAQGISAKTGIAKMKSRLVIDCVTRKHEGFYTCVSNAGSKTVKASQTLLLIEGVGHGDLESCIDGQRKAPRIVSWTPTAMESMGIDIVLPCKALGMPTPSVYWLDEHNNVLGNGRYQVSSNGDLTISSLTWSDMGEYTCVAQSAEGKDAVSTFVYPYMNQT